MITEPESKSSPPDETPVNVSSRRNFLRLSAASLGAAATGFSAGSAAAPDAAAY